MNQARVDILQETICTAIDLFNEATPVTVLEILRALEQVRHGLTEAFLSQTKE